MSLRQQLRELKQERREEVRNLHVTYLRTKRDIKRAVSPDRLIRRHLGASLGAAAVAGFVLAPRLLGSRKKQTRRKTGVGNWFRRMVKKVVPQAAGLWPESAPAGHAQQDGEAAATEAADHEQGTNGYHRPQRGLFYKLLTELAVLLFSRLDVRKMVTDLAREFMEKMHRDAMEREERAARSATPAEGEMGREDRFGDVP